nr:cation-translocating P-type ATPase [uncultured Cellulosilyticum sp.]
MEAFFNKEKNEVLDLMKSRKEGLSEKEVKERLSQYGENILSGKKHKSWIQVFLEQFKDVLVIVLIVSAIISFISGNEESTVVILVVITLNAILGTIQYFKAQKSLESLKALAVTKVKVIREGKQILVPSEQVVPGDVMVLEAGDLIAADGRIIENFNLQVNESSLTGESESINKQDDVINVEENIPLGDQKNSVFSGSLVTYGRAVVVVTHTGMATEIGKIANLMNKVGDKQTPLQMSLDEFSKKLAFIIIGICVVVFGLSLYRKMAIIDALMFAVALAVAAIPEALSSIVTIVLAMGTQNMAKQNAIMKELKAAEGLGCVSVICSDKTGTLTQNKMTVKKLFRDGAEVGIRELKLENHLDDYLMKACVLCNDSITREKESMGDPTEIALVNFAELYGIDEEEMRSEIKRQQEIAFDSDRKLMSTLHKIDNKLILFTKGATDVLLERITYIETSKGKREINKEDRLQIAKANEQFSNNGLRVLGFAYKEIPEEREITLDDECDYTFLGLVAMIDPPREESKEAVDNCIKAGIRTVMITGDHKVTASSIAREIGILQEGQIAVEGIELDKMSDAQLDEKIEDISVYARVSPAHKIRIVEAWQRRGNIVAMTGDGVNDAPALKKANIGIAMGITGTEVSKDAASMILMDDNFATIVKAVVNGRNIYSNIKNAIGFLLSGNTAGILCVLATSLLGLPIPFAAVQLLFINLVTDSLPAIAIGMEQSRDDLLKQKPRHPKEKLLNKMFMKTVGIQGVLLAVFTMMSYYIGLTTGDSSVAMTMAFGTLCLARLLHGFNCRGEGSIYKLGLLSNKASVIAFVIGVLLLNLVLFMPGLSEFCAVSPLNERQIISLYGFAIFPTVCIQIYKMFKELGEFRRSHKYEVSEKQ